jgi:hypothetical protein
LQWRYFCGPEQTLAVYRWPANGKGLAEQRLAEVEVFCSDGKWRGNQREVLTKEEVSGWFSESIDEISEEQAAALMVQIGKM